MTVAKKRFNDFEVWVIGASPSKLRRFALRMLRAMYCDEDGFLDPNREIPGADFVQDACGIADDIFGVHSFSERGESE